MFFWSLAISHKSSIIYVIVYLASNWNINSPYLLRIQFFILQKTLFHNLNRYTNKSTITWFQVKKSVNFEWINCPCCRHGFYCFKRKCGNYLNVLSVKQSFLIQTISISIAFEWQKNLKIRIYKIDFTPFDKVDIFLLSHFQYISIVYCFTSYGLNMNTTNKYSHTYFFHIL